jgi:uncharacterized protein
VAITLTEETTNALSTALTDRMPCLVATASGDGRPDLSYRGSLMVFDEEHLAFWERAKGETLANLEENPHVAILYRNAETRIGWRFYGVAEILRDGDVQAAIMERTHPFELAQDPDRTGYAVLMRVDRVRSGPAVVMQREGA